MLRLPLVTAGRKLDMGSGETKDKLMVIGLVVVILAVIVVLILKFKDSGGKGFEEADTMVQCVDPACGYKLTLTNEEYGELVALLDSESVHGMDPLRVECQQCKNPILTAVKGFKCPACDELSVRLYSLERTQEQLKFITRAQRTIRSTEPTICPSCGVDVNKYWVENRGKSRK